MTFSRGCIWGRGLVIVAAAFVGTACSASATDGADRPSDGGDSADKGNGPYTSVLGPATPRAEGEHGPLPTHARIVVAVPALAKEPANPPPPVVPRPAPLAPSHATHRISIEANLTSLEQVPADAWDPANPVETANYSTTVGVFDGRGGAHALSLYFAKTCDDGWDYHALFGGDDLEDGAAGVATEVGSGSLSFAADGDLARYVVNQTLTVDLRGGSGPQTIGFDLGVPRENGGSGLGGISQFPSASSTIARQAADGSSR